MAYQNLVGQFVYQQPLLRAKFDQLGDNDQYLKDNNWQDGVKAVFFQATVPTGWTQDVSANDRFLRVVNNTGGNPGGAVGGSLSVAAGLTLAHTHATFSTEANHTHATLAAHQHAMSQSGFGNFGTVTRPASNGMGNVVGQFAGVNAAATLTEWTKVFNSVVNDYAASSAAGTHNHSVNSALSNTIPNYMDIVIGIKSTSSGYTDLTNQFNHNDRIRYEPFAAVGGLYGNDSFTNARLTPTGTISLFFNAAAPAGWSKLTTQNDRALRIVSGAGGGTGGNLGIGSAIVLAHTHTISSAGTHSHTLSTHRHDVAAGPTRTLNDSTWFWMTLDGSNFVRPTNNDGTVQNVLKARTAAAGGGASSTDPNHVHTIGSSLTSINLAYVDMIQCQKLSTGAPYAFQDLTATVQYKKLVSYQRLNKFAQNDEYLKFHVMPAGSVMSFYQSAIPSLWTLISAQHDKVLRVVSGAGGGSGGSFLISNAITLVHTHTIATYTHSHTAPTHSHAFDTVSQAAGTIGAISYVGVPLSSQSFLGVGNITGSGVGRGIISPSATVNDFNLSTSSNGHNHGGVTNSQLSNVTFQYANVILCQKS